MDRRYAPDELLLQTGCFRLQGPVGNSNASGKNMSHQAQFEKIAEDVKKLKSRPTDLQLLDLYGLYKQAVMGDVNIDEPGMTDMKGKAKWGYWNSRKGMSKEDAMSAYIALAEELIQKYGM